MRARLSGFLLAIGLLSCGGGSDGPTGTGSRVYRIVIEPGTHTFVYAGERAAFRATPYDAQGEVLNGAGAISWWASDSTLVRIDSSGLAVAVREGQVRVSASLDGVTALARVGVSYGQARLRCTSCHGEGGAHGPGMFPGLSCSACHRAALDAPGAQHHERPDSGHAVVASGFGLQLPHDTLACTGCHQPGDGRPRYQPAGVEDCYACHRAQYDSATAIGKHLPGFPTTCTGCHTTSQWPGATFDHDRQFFPVFSGTHRGAWSSCSTCHTVPTDYAQFSCLGCHEHAQAAMDQEHRGRSGYAYDSAACLRCHPRP